jgi:uracil-DNA glycosylase
VDSDTADLEGRRRPARTQLEGAVGSSDDEIYDRYLRKAIREINELGDEIGRAGEERTPVLGSGHPLADVLMLKWSPQRSETQEGVAFFGRAGQAILKSLQRLRVDPMAVYGTNCVKFEGGDADETAQAWLTQELHIVQPKLVIVMGERGVALVYGLHLPL